MPEIAFENTVENGIFKISRNIRVLHPPGGQKSFFLHIHLQVYIMKVAKLSQTSEVANKFKKIPIICALKSVNNIIDGIQGDVTCLPQPENDPCFGEIKRE